MLLSPASFESCRLSQKECLCVNDAAIGRSCRTGPLILNDDLECCLDFENARSSSKD